MVVEKQQFQYWGRRWESLYLLHGELWAGGFYLALGWGWWKKAVDWTKS
jgi:hypothetical protein